MRRTALNDAGRSSSLFKIILLLLLPWILETTTQAQAPPTPITSSGLNTVVTTNGTVYNITGGTRPSDGANLFHGFGNFNVPDNNIANFVNETALPTSIILGRITGGNISHVLGTIQTQGFGNANLFLMNPAGFLFGPNATVNVGGMVTFTSADYLRLTDGVRFDAVPNASADGLLSPAPVAAFGFLGSNPGAITVQGSQFTVAKKTGISLIGGNITVEGGTPEGMAVQPARRLSSPSGQINLASVASPGEVLATNFLPNPGMTMGTVTLSQGVILDVSADAAGTVRIRSGQFVINNATIAADTINSNGAPTAIDINVTGEMSMSNDLTPALTARTTGDGTAGAINIASGNLEAITSSSDNLLALIDTHTSGTGTAGNVSIAVGDLHATNEDFFIDSGSAGPGHGGDVTVSGTTIHIDGPDIATGDFRFGQLLEQEVTGSAGNLTIRASDSLKIEAATITTEAFLARAGDLTLQARDIHITGNSFVSVDGDLGGATITVDADRLTVNTVSVLNNNTEIGPGGDITITARIVEQAGGGVIQTATTGNGHAGNIHVIATERITLDDRGNPTPKPSGLLSNSLGDFGSSGNSGAIDATTPRLEILSGAQINTSTRSSGRAGDLTISAQSISISGERPFESPDDFFEIGSTRASGIYTRTVGSEFCAGPCGDAGNVTVTTGSLNLESGGTINSGTINSGTGGAITINAANEITMSGTMIDGTSSGIFSRTVGIAPDSGDGGNIALTAGQSVTISNGASVSASSKGPGNAGNIHINAGQTFVATNSNSAVTTEADAASGGTITLLATDTVQLTNSRISASVADGPGGGGDIRIDPQYVILQNSQILAQTAQGQGGEITITTNLFLPDATSLVNANSGSGVNGTVTIQSPNSPASGKIQPLGNQPLEATSLLNQRCAALADGKFSSFTVAGRDSLPAEPSSWLASPLATLSADTGRGVKGERERSVARGEGREGMPLGKSPADESTLLSLRQVAPAGFLTQAFAVDWSAGCQS